MMRFIYTFLIYPLIYILFFILSFFDKKIKKGIELRKNKSWLLSRFSNEIKNDKLIWIHVASGEFEYAKPVIKELKKTPGIKILVSYFSPSVIRSLENFNDVDFFVPTPWDTPWHWNEFIKFYKPKILLISRTDLWPNMIWQTHKNKIPSVLFSATLPSHSPRVASFWGRLFYSLILQDLTQVSCVSEVDQDLFLKTCHILKVSADGDTRYDQVFARLDQDLQNKEVSTLISEIKNNLPQDKKVFIAGSTWSEDEKVLIPGLKKYKNQLQIIIAPHEVDSEHLKNLEAKLQEYGMNSVRLKDLTELNSKVLIIDRVGILASLYPLSDFSFVGGSFKKSVHSVMEPLASGNFTLVGPMHYNSREALLFKSKGYVKEIENYESLEKITGSEIMLSKVESSQRKTAIQNSLKSQTGVSKTISDLALSFIK